MGYFGQEADDSSSNDYSVPCSRFKVRHLFHRTREEGDTLENLEGPDRKENVGMEDRRIGLRFWPSYGYPAWPWPVSYSNLCLNFLVLIWGSPAVGWEFVMLGKEEWCFDLGLPGSKILFQRGYHNVAQEKVTLLHILVWTSHKYLSFELALATTNTQRGYGAHWRGSSH